MIVIKPGTGSICKGEALPDVAGLRWSSANAHLAGKDDLLVKVGPMLDQVADWGKYLEGDCDTCDELLDRYSRTGRPLGNKHSVSRLESLTGAVLTRKRPGRKSKGADK